MFGGSLRDTSRNTSKEVLSYEEQKEEKRGK